MMRLTLFLAAALLTTENMRKAADPDPEAEAVSKAEKGEEKNMMVEIGQALRRLVQELTERIGAAQAQNADESKTAITALQTQLTALQANINSMGAEMTVKINSATESNTQAISAAETDARSAQQTAASKVDQATSQLETLTKAIEQAKNGASTAINKLTDSAANLPDEMTGYVDQVTKDTQSVAKELKTEVSQTTETAVKGIQSNIKLINDKVRTDMKGLNNQIASGLKSVQTMLEDLRKTSSNSIGELSEKITATSTMVQQLSSKIEAADSAREALQAQLQSKLETLGKTVQSNQKAVVAAVDQESKQMNAKTDSKINMAKINIVNEVEHQRAILATTLTDSVDHLKAQMTEATDGQQETNRKVDALHTTFDAKNAELEAKIESNLQKVDETKVTVNQAANGMQGQVNDAVAHVNGNVTAANLAVATSLDASDKRVTAAIDANSAAVLENIKAAETSVSQKINDASNTATNLLQTGEKRQAALAQKASDLLSNIKGVAHDVAAQKAAVEKEVPATAARIEQSYKAVADKMDAVGTQLSKSRDDVMKVLATSTESIDTHTQDAMHGVEDRVRTQLHQSSDAVETQMTSLLEQISALKAGANQDYELSRQAQSSLRDQLNSAAQRAQDISKRSEHQGSELQLKISEALTQLHAADAREASSSASMATSLAQTMHAQVHAASEDAGRKIKAAMDKQSASLSSFEQKAAKQIAADEALMQQYSSQATDHLGQVTERVKDLGFSLQKTELAAETKNSELLDQTHRLAATQKALADRAEHTASVEKEMIAKRTGELKQLVVDKVAAVSAADKSQVAELQRQTASAFAEEKARQELEKNKVGQTVKSWQDKMTGEIGQVGDAVQSAEAGLKSFEAGEKQAEQSFQKEVSSLDKDIASSEDRVDASIKREDASVAQIMRGELGNMQGLVETFKDTQADAKKKVSDMKVSFATELKLYQQQGEAKSKELADKLKWVEEHAADQVKEFREDAKASQSELAQTQQRLDKVVSSTLSQVTQFHTRLAEVQKSRVDEAAKLHGDVEQVKNELSTAMGGTVQSIKQLEADTTAAYQQMSTRQQQFDQQLQQASTDAAAKDAAGLAQVGSRMDALEQEHSRLAEWQRSFKHRTLAWRQEVERRLGQLSGQLGTAEGVIATSQLQADLASGNLQASSFVETGGQSGLAAENAALRAKLQQEEALNSELTKENKQLYAEDDALDKRLASIEKLQMGKGIA